MPNHIHGIIEITGAQTPTPVGTRHGVSEMGGRVGTSHGMSQLDSQQNGMSQLGRGISTGAKIRQTDTRLCFDRRLLEKEEKIAGMGKIGKRMPEKRKN